MPSQVPSIRSMVRVMHPFQAGIPQCCSVRGAQRHKTVNCMEYKTNQLKSNSLNNLRPFQSRFTCYTAMGLQYCAPWHCLTILCPVTKSAGSVPVHSLGTFGHIPCTCWQSQKEQTQPHVPQGKPTVQKGFQLLL